MWGAGFFVKPMKPPIPPRSISQSEWYSLPQPEKALLIAGQFCDDIHVQEEPLSSNSGPWVDEFLRLARTDTGLPWGAAFVTACQLYAGKDFFSTDYGDGVRYPSSVISWVDWARATGRWSRTPRRGRLFAITRAGQTHIGFVTKASSDGMFETIEGNSNVSGGTDGEHVCRRTRSIDRVNGFINLL